VSEGTGKKALINFCITTGKYQTFIDTITAMAAQRKSAYVCFANVHMFSEAYWNADFMTAVNAADIVAPDGQPLKWMLKFLYGIKQDRVAGMDALPDLLKRMEKEGLPVYFYGGTQEMLDKTAAYLKINFPSLKVAGLYSPPFREQTDEEVNETVNTINQAAPALILVFLGCPKQEKWMASMKGRINGVMAGVGGAIPVAIGMQKRAPVWMRKAGLEWLFRFFQEPRRLYKRYAVTNSLFIRLMIKEFIKIRVIQPFKKGKPPAKHTNAKINGI
jgi:N-acetylglucosaminyldiphosphoundecaprenol N-acetyl-beta-D-mannosaminyltransferase